MNVETYFELKAERAQLKARLQELNQLIEPANCKYHFETLTYSQFGKAIEFWYDANNHEHDYFKRMQTSVAWGLWTERYNEFIATGTCSHLYTKYVMQGMTYNEAFIRDNNENPEWSLGGFTYKKPAITEICYKN